MKSKKYKKESTTSRSKVSHYSKSTIYKNNLDCQHVIIEQYTIIQAYKQYKKRLSIRWRINFTMTLFISSIAYIVYPDAIWVWGIFLLVSALSLGRFWIRYHACHKKIVFSNQKIASLKTVQP